MLDRSVAVEVNYRTKCQSRVRDLLLFCDSEYGADSRLVELIAACLIPLQQKYNWPVLPLRVIIKGSRSEFWPQLSRALVSLGHPPLGFMGQSVQELQSYMKQYHGQTQLILQTPDSLTDRQQYARHLVINRQSLIVDASNMLVADRQPASNSWSELAQLLKSVIDANSRRVFVRAVKVPHRVGYLTQLLKKLRGRRNPRTGGQYFTAPIDVRPGKLGLVPSAHAALYGRLEIVKEDWDMLRWVLQSTVRPDMVKMLSWYWMEVLPYKELAELPSQSRHRQISRTEKVPLTKQFRKSVMPELMKRHVQSGPRRLVDMGWLRNRYYKDSNGVPVKDDPELLGWDLTREAEELAKLLFDEKYRIEEERE